MRFMTTASRALRVTDFVTLTAVAVACLAIWEGAVTAGTAPAPPPGASSAGGEDELCTCGEGQNARLKASPVPPPPPSVSGLSHEGVYFIPEPLPPEESYEACTKETIPGASCLTTDSQSWEQPSSYTASIFFTADKGPHQGAPDSHGKASEGALADAHGEEQTGALAGQTTDAPPQAAESLVGTCEAPGSLERHVEAVFGATLKETREIRESAGTRQRRETVAVGAVLESPCRRGRAPTYEERRQHFLAEYGELYSLAAEATAERELKRLRGDIYVDYAGEHTTNRSGLPQREPQQPARAAGLPSSSSSTEAYISNAQNTGNIDKEQQILSFFKDLSLHVFGNAHSRNPSAKLTGSSLLPSHPLARLYDLRAVLASLTLQQITSFVFPHSGSNSVCTDGEPVVSVGHGSAFRESLTLQCCCCADGLSDQRMREARDLTLKFFGAAEKEFAVVFTSGATAAIKLVGEDFPFTAESSFFYLRINHNSVLGVREFAYAAGVKSVKALSEREVEAILKDREAAGLVIDWSAGTVLPYCLFGFPLKDNFNGTSYPTSWIEKIHKYGLSDECRWLVLLDAAAAAPTSPIRLSGTTPERSADFLAISFYKIFGHPTGLGALVLKRSTADVLKKAIGMEQIERHIGALTRHLFRSLKAFRHRNGAPFALLYWGRREDPSGGIVNFNLLRPDGSFVPFSEVEAKTAAAGIHLRTGCFCNPGGCQDYLGLTGAEIVDAARARESCSDPTGALLSRPTPQLVGLAFGPRSYAKAVGSVRISLGYLTTFADVDGLLDFLVRTFLWH
ncbi:molybdopterin cofactor [Cyclospora cayetanensis]|uniref:Molybdopterin cofactor n=1 Tax=Cyclospora cayetanensis TaxID=88456 RepID=A0A1D3CQU8_9EIME|nr:molybdopterin cofactor [Cyclospora cayetanensis]